MTDFLNAHLDAKGKEHSSLSALVNQWGFDKQLIPKALQTVGSMFPHYSRHDESHSKQILVNIERLLGDNICRLTGTDTWLILEAAYWHDIGMVVPQQDVIDACQQEKFQEYLEEIKLAPHHELHKFAVSFDPTSTSACFTGADTPFDAVDKFRQLMAEWFRRRHPRRAELIVQSPWASAAISSPRTELIPKRLFNILGRICYMHGLPFSDVVSESGLPFREAGLAREDCHPRFVACLLRMGDLLDLDDNRFCPVMQRIAGNNRPNLSKAHEDKHAGIRHLRLDQKRIEISAECESIEGYLETFKWFSWVREELQNQMARWQDIVPHRSLGLLPTLGKLTVSLSGNIQVLDEGKRPQFVLDNERAIALLQGNNIYSSKYACIRELLQNAVDATLMRLWIMNGGESAEGWQGPSDNRAAVQLQSYPVKIKIAERPSVAGVVDKTRWAISISDNGIGISKDDLAYMLRIGGSQKNPQRQRVIRTMPEWMKPSGSFGIGFQSVFMMSQVVTLITKSVYTSEILQVTMYNPTGPNEGLALVEMMPNEPARIPGTTVEFIVEMDAYTSNYSINIGDRESIAAAVLNSGDPVLNERFPMEAAQLADNVDVFAKRCIIPIQGELAATDAAFAIGSSLRGGNFEQPGDNWTLINFEDEAVALSLHPTAWSYGPNAMEAFYRGQPFDAGFYIPFVQVGIDIMSGRAGSWLSTSRDRVAGGASEAMRSLVVRALQRKVEQDLGQEPREPAIEASLRPAYSLFLEVMALADPVEWGALARRLGDAWLDLKLWNKPDTFRKFFDGNGGVVTEKLPNSGEQLNGNDYIIDSDADQQLLSVMLAAWVRRPGGTVCVIEPEATKEDQVIGAEIDGRKDPFTAHFQNAKKFRTRYSLKKEPQPLYTPLALATRLASRIRSSGRNERFVVADDCEWKPLWLKIDTPMRVPRLFITTDTQARYFVLPFLYQGRNQKVEATPSQLEKLAVWTCSRLDYATTVPEVRGHYERLIKFIDEEIMGKSPFRVLWEKARSDG